MIDGGQYRKNYGLQEAETSHSRGGQGDVMEVALMSRSGVVSRG